MSRSIDIARLAICLGVSQLAGVIGGVFTASSVKTWYQTLSKPSFNPPDWVFGPVWITLFALMGIAAWLVWRKGLGSPHVKAALILFVIQLVLNSTWSFIFFGLQEPRYAFVQIIFLWAAILLTSVWFLRVSPAAGVLMLPYLLWVSFAAVLNLAISRLNP